MILCRVPPNQSHEKTSSNLIACIQVHGKLQNNKITQQLGKERQQRNPKQEQQVQPPQSPISTVQLLKIPVVTRPPSPCDEEGESVVEESYILVL
jgi:hypothetical protein